MQANKSPGHDEINFNVIKSCFGSLSKPSLNIFRLSSEEEIFPDNLKNVKKMLNLFLRLVTNPIDQSLFYLVFPKYLRKSCIKEFSIIYQQCHSTEHAIMQLIDQINDKFESNCFTLGIFIDLFKAFDDVNHQILISNLKNYAMKGENLSWLKNYLENRKQHLNYNNDVINLAQIN